MSYELKHRTAKTIAKGTHFPLGATLTPEGVNFSIYSKNATEVFLLLFDKPDGEPTDIIQLVNRDKFIWHGLVKGIRAGQLYGAVEAVACALDAMLDGGYELVTCDEHWLASLSSRAASLRAPRRSPPQR